MWQCSHSCALPWKLRVLVRRAEAWVRFQRAIYRCGGPSFLNFTIQARSILRHLRHDLLLVGVQLSYRCCLSIAGPAMAPKRRRIESGKKLVLSVSEWQKCSRRFACHPVPFARLFVCAYVALHDVSSYAMTYSHKPHSAFFVVVLRKPFSFCGNLDNIHWLMSDVFGAYFRPCSPPCIQTNTKSMLFVRFPTHCAKWP